MLGEGKEKSASANGGPRSHVRARASLCSTPTLTLEENFHFSTRLQSHLRNLLQPPRNHTWKPGINFENPPYGSACNVQGQCMHLAPTKNGINRATIVCLQCPRQGGIKFSTYVCDNHFARNSEIRMLNDLTKIEFKWFCFVCLIIYCSTIFKTNQDDEVTHNKFTNKLHTIVFLKI